ncbi:uncharacterized mitochondrial protein-like protein [Tanacetum coccineum]
MLVEVGKFTFPVDFVILEIEEDSKVPLILGRPFLHTADAIIRVKQKQLNLGVGTKRMTFHIDSAMKHSFLNDDTCFNIDLIDEILEEDFDALLEEGSKMLYSIKGIILEEQLFVEFDEFVAMTTEENSESDSDTEEPPFEKITFNTDYKIKTSLKEPLMDLELKPLPDNLEYAFLEEPYFLPVVISSQLSKENKNKVVSVLKGHKYVRFLEKHGRIILESIENGPLIWPTIEENGLTRPRKYSELTPADAIQADCDVKATNIILQGLPPEVYALVSNHRITKELWETIQLLMQGTSLTKQERECKLYDEFDKFAYKKGETLRDLYLRFSLLLNDMNIYNVKLEQFQLRNLSNPKQQATINDGSVTLQPIQGRKISFAMGSTRTYTARVSGSNSGKQMTIICYNYKGEGHMSKQCTKPKRKRDDSWFKDKVLLVQAQANGQILHEEELAFLADPGIVEVTLMANLSHYGSDVLTEVHNSDNMDNNMINQDVQVRPSSEQLSVVNHLETEITSDNNIIPSSQYVHETQQAAD